MKILFSIIFVALGSGLSSRETSAEKINQERPGHALDEEQEQKGDDDSVQVFNAFVPDNRGPTSEECQQYCHADCVRLHSGKDVTKDVQTTRRCTLANQVCNCGPKPDDFNPAECHLFCNKDCNSFKFRVFSVSQDLLKFPEAASEANRKARRCMELKPRCNCDINPKTLYPIINGGNSMVPVDGDGWFQSPPGTMYTSRRHAANSFFPGAIVICMVISVVAAVIVTVIACRRQFRFRPESYYQRNLGTISAGPPSGIGFISVQLSGQPHPRVWSYDTSGASPFITSLQGSHYPQQQFEQAQSLPSFQAPTHPLPAYEPPPPYPGK